MKVFFEECIRFIRIILFHRIMFFKEKLDIEESHSIIIVSPHPDDEVLGCGGIIRHYLDLSLQVYVIIMTHGELCNIQYCSKEETVRHRSKLTKDAMNVLGLPENHLIQLNFPDCEINKRDETEVRMLITILEDIDPDVVFIPHPFDRHGDHIATGDIIKEYYAHNPKVKMYYYCVWFWFWVHHAGKINWDNAVVANLSEEEKNIKCKSMDAYFKPLAPFGKPWPGLLPKSMLNACRYNKELFFKIDI